MALTVPVLGGCSGGSGGTPVHATVLPEPLPLPEFSLTDQEGRAFTRQNFRHRTSLLFFGFTHCPDICPATLQLLVSARQQIAERQGGQAGALPDIVLVSVDPERDTPEQLRRYVGYFGEEKGISAATGSMEEVKKLTGALGIFFEKVPAGGDDYSVSHSTAVLVVGPDAELTALFSSPHKIDSIAHDVPLLMASR
ncbi:MAG: SCO family protein [Woeseia sp.]